MTPVEDASTRATRPPGWGRKRRSAWDGEVGDLQRKRIFSALITAIAEHGIERTSVTRIIALARISRRTFYDLFDSRDDCLLAAIEQVLTLTQQIALEAWETEEEWLSRVRVALQALLEFFDEEPQLARLCIVDSNIAVATISARRRQVLTALASVVDAGSSSAHDGPPTLTAEGIVGGTLAVVHARIVEPETGGLIELLNPLMNFIARPYLGAPAARRELRRARRASRPLREPVPKHFPTRSTTMRMTYRTMRVLSAIASQPGLSNIQAARQAGVSDQGQISKLLNRLARLGLVENTGEGQPFGAPNAWHLTPEGKHLTWTVERMARNNSR
jgi:AcrR family transcriptional regulator